MAAVEVITSKESASLEPRTEKMRKLFAAEPARAAPHRALRVCIWLPQLKTALSLTEVPYFRTSQSRNYAAIW
ncbi:hypothetical protein [Bradyrhizobium sp. 195]|uniref:hypothetical protein n=1 Tax=Bradyrhizobium sp. 195 TaxID=2782662 RepID=UPI0020013EB1|nr:hypothetical protein [Bradyrhizobium sp. 195]UPK28190.1 hypothetical protein IVB26_06615 [Bradyrhizobium sp. 195]